jgi:hypothetical protein
MWVGWWAKHIQPRTCCLLPRLNIDGHHSWCSALLGIYGPSPWAARQDRMCLACSIKLPWNYVVDIISKSSIMFIFVISSFETNFWRRVRSHRIKLGEVGWVLYFPLKCMLMLSCNTAEQDITLRYYANKIMLKISSQILPKAMQIQHGLSNISLKNI